MSAIVDPKEKCLTALKSTGRGRVKVVKEALFSGLLFDPALHEPLVNALSDKSAVFADTIADDVLPDIGEPLLEQLLANLTGLPDPVVFRRLRVIRKLDLSAAENVARRYAEAKHRGLSVECINILSGSALDSELLMGRTASRVNEISGAAYRALHGISEKSVQNFLGEKLIHGSGFPQLSIAYAPNMGLSQTILEALSEKIYDMEDGKTLDEAEARHLLILIESAAGQDHGHFDEILQRCINFSLDIKGCVEPYATFSLDFAEATFEAVATNPVESSKRLLVDVRETLGL